MPNVDFMFGLPCSGKTTYIQENYVLGIYNNNGKFKRRILISADKIKEEHPEYNPENTEVLHQYSVEVAEQNFYNALKTGDDIVFDGGGINNNYNVRLATAAIEAGYTVNLIIIDTPAHVCLTRNKKRHRKVPESAIINKAILFKKALHNLVHYINGVVKNVQYYTNKYIFVDMDGTIAAYQQLPLDEFGAIDFTAGEYFKFALPVRPVIDKLNSSYKDSCIKILSAIPDSLCEKDKNEWLDKHFPIDYNDRYFIGNKKYKAVMLRNIMRREKIDPKDVTVIDDDHYVLLSYQAIGVNAIHISEFLTW